MTMLRTLDLFSGIGGFSLGLERTGGFKTVAFCEIEPFCQQVLAKHWPEVPCYDDVRSLTADRLRADGIAVDVICGGFPCQDISLAGKGAGIEGERSGLWSEYARLIGELRPRYVIVENVAALLGRGLDRVLGDLATLGLDAEWHCIPAAAVGAPHRRDRIWVVAYPARDGALADASRQRGAAWREAGHMASAAGAAEGDGEERQWRGDAAGHRGADVADAESRGCGDGRQGRLADGGAGQPQPQQAIQIAGDANVARLAQWQGVGSHLGEELAAPVGADWWSVEPAVGRVAHGVPARVDRLRALGNAVVPQVVTLIGRAILAAEAETRRAA